MNNILFINYITFFSDKIQSSSLALWRYLIFLAQSLLIQLAQTWDYIYMFDTFKLI